MSFLILFLSIAWAAPVKIMPLGDSLTAGGYNVNKQWFVGSGYRARFKTYLAAKNIEVDLVGSLSHGLEDFTDRQHEGHSGLRIEEIAAKFEPSLISNKPDIVLLAAGSNDLFQNFKVDTAPERFFLIVKRIRELSPETEIFVASVIATNNRKFNERINKFNWKLMTLAKQYNQQNPKRIIWIEMATRTSFTPKDFTDGVHPTTPAYEKMGEVWAEAVSKYLTETKRFQ